MNKSNKKSLLQKILRETNPLTIYRRLNTRFVKFFIDRKPVEFVGISSNRSESDDGQYVAVVNAAAQDYQIFKNFKRHPAYTAILEHASEAEGLAYLVVALEQSPEFLNKIEDIKSNDEVGNPIVYEYPTVGRVSPSTLRYLKVASDLNKYFGENIGKRIVEIGVGYGGQCLTIDKLFIFKRYYLFDLSPVLNLVTRYLECHMLRGSYQCTTLNQFSPEEDFDLAISNYAFSELPSNLQKIYIEKVLSKAKRGYLTMNSGYMESVFTKDKLTIEELRQLLPKFEIIEERPLTAKANYIIVWGHQ